MSYDFCPDNILCGDFGILCPSLFIISPTISVPGYLLKIGFQHPNNSTYFISSSSYKVLSIFKQHELPYVFLFIIHNYLGSPPNIINKILDLFDYSENSIIKRDIKRTIILNCVFNEVEKYIHILPTLDKNNEFFEFDKYCTILMLLLFIQYRILFSIYVNFSNILLN